MEQLNSFESMPALPPRRDRHGKKKAMHRNKPHKKFSELEIVQLKPEENSLASLDSAKEQQNLEDSSIAENQEETEHHSKPRGSLMVANVIMMGFLLLVGGILFYTIKHY